MKFIALGLCLPVLLGLGLTSLPGCASAGSAARPARSTGLGRQVLPLPPDACMSFRAGAAEVLQRDTRAVVRQLPPAPGDFGRPIASSVDLSSLMAAVVHERGLAVVNLTSSETEPQWLPLAWPVPPTSVYVADAYAATLAGTEVRLWDLTNATELWRQDLGAWSREKKLGAPVCAVPDRRDPKRLTVVFSSRERTDLQVLDFSRGSLELAASASNLFENTGRSWYLVERCAYDGERLFLSGTHEETKLSATGQWVPSPAPFLMKVDLASREHEILFHEDSHTRDQEVDELAAAAGLVATLRRDGLLRVFRGHAKAYEGQVPRGSALAWLTEDDLAVYGAGSLEVVHVAD
ncbi:MAG: hypothetical protein IPK67_04495 [Planctomycetes bacterium]|nr:hypothetical protein [Planctomycetota bacterium]